MPGNDRHKRRAAQLNHSLELLLGHRQGQEEMKLFLEKFLSSIQAINLNEQRSRSSQEEEQAAECYPMQVKTAEVERECSDFVMAD